MPSSTTIVWLRRDLRLADNPALRAAVDRDSIVVPVFIWAPHEEEPWAPGEATMWWLHHSLVELGGRLDQRGSALIIRRADNSLAELRKLAKKCNADAVYWNRLYDPALRTRDEKIKQALRNDGIEAKSFNSTLLFEPHMIRTNAGDPFKVFTPFWRKCLAEFEPPIPEAETRKIPAPQNWPKSDAVEALGLLPKLDWADRFSERWQPGELGAQAKLRRFLDEAANEYADDRDRPDAYGTSRLSPHLRWGEIGPRQIWQAVREAEESRSVKEAQAKKFLAEVGWREFAYHLLFHFPETTDKPLRPEFEKFPWRNSQQDLAAWQRGATGYPIVDAGMRELWTTGWMHNRVRMIVASFLVKHLLLPWQDGAKWFWDTLVDADLASNTLGWQWSAGCGADAAPYFRVFNPILQGPKFDPNGIYVREWVPEIAHLPGKILHTPWEAGTDLLDAAPENVSRNYPSPIVDHREGRERALAAFEKIKKKKE